MQLTTDNLKLKEKYKEDYLNIVIDLLENTTVREMKNFRQHYDSTCFEHCLEVSYWSYIICKKLGLDYISAARAGILHDLFLYDWRNSKKNLHLKGFHAFIHPQIALNNSLKLFELNDKEKDIIIKHMWPVTFFKFPKYAESYVITLTDKLSAIKSCLDFYSNILSKKSIYKYAYIFFSFLIFKIG